MFQEDDPRAGLSKIRSSALRDEVIRHGKSPITVVVEVKLPQATFDIVKQQDSGDLRTSRLQLIGPEPDSSESARRFDDARSKIESITGKPPESILAYSGSLVVEASGEQIRDIAELPNVAAIWSNDVR